jgi:long-chain fatty acid transport protein
MKRITVRGLVQVTAIVLCMVFSTRSWAGGAYIYETGNPTDIGLGSAGLAARAQDPGTVFTNPAGMTRFKQSELLLAGYALYLHAPFDPDSNTTTSGGDGNTNELFPGGSAAYVHPVSPKLALGISAPMPGNCALFYLKFMKAERQKPSSPALRQALQ